MNFVRTNPTQPPNRLVWKVLYFIVTYPWKSCRPFQTDHNSLKDICSCNISLGDNCHSLNWSLLLIEFWPNFEGSGLCQYFNGKVYGPYLKDDKCFLGPNFFWQAFWSASFGQNDFQTTHPPTHRTSCHLSLEGLDLRIYFFDLHLSFNQDPTQMTT